MGFQSGISSTSFTGYTSSRTTKKNEKAKIPEEAPKTPSKDLAIDEAMKTPFKDLALELDLEAEQDKRPLPEAERNIAPVFSLARQSGISKLQPTGTWKPRQAKTNH